MPPIQTNYNQRHEGGQLGAIADTRHVNARSLTFVSAPADGTIAFGRALGFGADDGTCGLAGNGFAGVVIRQKVQDAAIATDAFGDRETIGLMTEGAMYVRPTATVAQGDVVHFDPATGEISNAGGTLIADAIFETSANAGELARIYLK